MIQHRQIHGVMAKNRGSVIKMPRKKSPEKWGKYNVLARFPAMVPELQCRTISEQSNPTPSQGVDHECQEASEGLWCTSRDSPASGLDALVP
jgi:hypothetical protein